MRRDAQGRRLYLAEEFQPRTGHHLTDRVHVSHPGGKALIREDVYSLDTGESLGLSKQAFADAVSAREKPFSEQVDFEGFRRTLKPSKKWSLES
jgi:hypothetical protein